MSSRTCASSGDFSSLDDIYAYWRTLPVKGALPPPEPEAVGPEEALEEGLRS